jgi:hypothetical protein
LRENQSRDAHSDRTRMESRDRRRRYLLDEVRCGRTPLRHQSGSGILRCRSGNRDDLKSERDEDRHPQFDLHKLRNHTRRRRLVGRHDRSEARRTHGLAATAMDSGDHSQGCSSECPFHNARAPVSGDRSRMGRSTRRADRRYSVWRTARNGCTARHGSV